MDILHETPADDTALRDSISSFHGERPVSGSADLGVPVAWDITEEDFRGHQT